MAILANRGKIKNSVRDYGGFLSYLLYRSVTIFLLILSLYFLQFSYPRPIKNVINEIGGRVLNIVEYSSSAIINSASFIYNELLYFQRLETENIRLKMENKELKKQINNSLFLKSENDSLRKILKVKAKIDHEIITAKVIGTSITPYAQRATVNVGLDQGVQVDDVVRGPSGLLGRVVEVSDSYSVIMLLGDGELRLPILAIEENSYGILVKQNNYLEIIYLEDNHNFKVGSVIYTSGDGKIFPSSIPVGVVSKVSDDGVYVKLFEQINGMGFVMIEPSFSRKIKK